MTLRHRRRAARWLWNIGLPAAVSVGYFRIAADRHYLTDVLASVGVGTAMWLTIPRLVFKGRPSGWAPRGRLTVARVASGSIVGITCVW
jgi:membrane-associated phospholipid phosphatase